MLKSYKENMFFGKELYDYDAYYNTHLFQGLQTDENSGGRCLADGLSDHYCCT